MNIYVETNFVLELVFQQASVIAHLRQHHPSIACFLNRNSRDFNTLDLVDELNNYNCRMISRFDDGYGFIRSQL